MMKGLGAEMKERFLNYETAKGFYFVGMGTVLIIVAFYYQQHLLKAIGATVGWYFISEGIRKITINRVKQALELECLKEERKARVHSDC